VFVHGFACAHADWRFQIEGLRQRHEVVACDLRGHGATPGRADECSIEHFGGDVAALLANLELSPAVLVGHSMGCRVVLEANRLAPERVAGIVLVDGSRIGSGVPDAAEAAARAAIARAGYAAFAEDLFRQMFLRPSPQADAIVERALRTSAGFGAELWVRMARWSAAMLDPALDAVRAPLLAIQSTMLDAAMRRVPMRPGDTSPWLESLRKRGGRVEIVPDTGHFTMLEAPDTVNALIGAFAREL
jgi:pimeloyl-ACP methyl ester carboxylesterase